MASQHSFPTGYPNTQQNAIRMHFSAGPIMSGLVAPQQSKYTITYQNFHIGSYICNNNNGDFE